MNNCNLIVFIDISELPKDVEKAKTEQSLPSAEKQEVKESLVTPTKISQSVKQTVTREESPPPPPPPSTTGAVATATNSPHYAGTSTSYSQSPSSGVAPGSEGYSAYLQVNCTIVMYCVVYTVPL